MALRTFSLIIEVGVELCPPQEDFWEDGGLGEHSALTGILPPRSSRRGGGCARHSHWLWIETALAPSGPVHPVSGRRFPHVKTGDHNRLYLLACEDARSCCVRSPEPGPRSHWLAV